MKTLNQYITETAADNKYLGFSFDDMVFDYKHVEDIALRARKEIGKKYGLDSGKTKEIQHAILLQMREERKTRKTYNDNDITYYYRLDVPEKTKLDFECKEFVEYLKDYFWSVLVDKNLTKKIDMVKSRDWNYYMSYSSRDAILRYLRTVEWLDAHDPKTIQNKEDKENIIKAIEAELISQTKEFFEEFIERTKRWADRFYDIQEQQEEKYFPLVEKCKEQLNEIGTYSWGDIETRNKVAAIKKELDGYRSILNKARAVTLYHKEEYISRCEKEAENTFKHNINVLANKITDKGLNSTTIKVERIDEDPKYFELYITDGTKSLYARSILAAEYSDKVATHFRFIITDRRQK
jgi:hypothetical protein